MFLELRGKLLRDFAKDDNGPVKRPLGIAYDEELKIWIVADTEMDAVIFIYLFFY